MLKWLRVTEKLSVLLRDSYGLKNEKKNTKTVNCLRQNVTVYTTHIITFVYLCILLIFQYFSDHFVLCSRLHRFVSTECQNILAEIISQYCKPNIFGQKVKQLKTSKKKINK